MTVHLALSTHESNLLGYRLWLQREEVFVKPTHKALLEKLTSGEITKIDATDTLRIVIADIVSANPGCVCSQFINDETDMQETDLVFEIPAQQPKNWKRHNRSKEGKILERIFNCEPYDDQLRCYIRSEGEKLLEISIVGE